MQFYDKLNNNSKWLQINKAEFQSYAFGHLFIYLLFSYTIKIVAN